MAISLKNHWGNFVLAVQVDEARKPVNQGTLEAKKQAGWNFERYLPPRPIFPKIEFNFIDRSWRLFSTEYHVTAPPPPPKKEKELTAEEKKKQEEATADRKAGGIGLAALGTALAVAGYYYDDYQRQQVITNISKDNLSKSHLLPETELRSYISCLCWHKLQIDERSAAKVKGYMLAALSGIIGGLLLLGSVVVSKELKAVIRPSGYAAVIFTTAVAIFTFFRQLRNEEFIEPHRRAILGDREKQQMGLANIIMVQLENYDDTLRVPPPSYNFQYSSLIDGSYDPSWPLRNPEYLRNAPPPSF